MARVIIQEPDADVRALLERLVAIAGHEIVVCSMRCQDPPLADVLVLEPEAGLDTARALRRRAPALPIVCVAVQQPSPELIALGPTAVLPKPFAIEQFRDALAAALAPLC